jgi:predicted CopG family antitoxin
MATTVRISKELLQELEKLKKETMAKSYEEVIRKLIREAKRLKKSHFGSLPKLREFRREEIDRFD